MKRAGGRPEGPSSGRAEGCTESAFPRQEPSRRAATHAAPRHASEHRSPVVAKFESVISFPTPSSWLQRPPMQTALPGDPVGPERWATRKGGPPRESPEGQGRRGRSRPPWSPGSEGSRTCSPLPWSSAHSLVAGGPCPTRRKGGGHRDILAVLESLPTVAHGTTGLKRTRPQPQRNLREPPKAGGAQEGGGASSTGARARLWEAQPCREQQAPAARPQSRAQRDKVSEGQGLRGPPRPHQVPSLSGKRGPPPAPPPACPVRASFSFFF